MKSVLRTIKVFVTITPYFCLTYKQKKNVGHSTFHHWLYFNARWHFR